MNSMVCSSSLMTSIERPRLRSSLTRTLNDSGTPASTISLSLDDRLVRLDATDHVVRLDGQHLLEDVRRAVGFKRPDFHLAEPLPAELRLTTQRLLRDERVRAGRPRVDLVLNQVSQLQHIDDADRHRAVELLAGAAVVELEPCRRAAAPPPRASERISSSDAPSKTGVAIFDAECFGRPAEVRFEHLADVHARRNADRIQNDVDRRAIRQVRHVLDRKDPRDDTLIAVATRHLVALGDLPLLGDADADHLVDAGRQFVVGSLFPRSA